MRKVIHRNSISRIFGFSLAVLLAFSTSLFAQEADTQVANDLGGDPENGKALFKANCAACHALNKRMTGPPLAGIADKYDREWLYSWIRNSAAMIADGDPQAIAIWEEYNRVPMNAFPQLSNEDIDDIIAYTMAPPPAPAPAEADGAPVEVADPSGVPNEIILVGLALVFAMLVVMLLLVNKTLKRIALANGIQLEEEQEKRLPVWRAFAQNQFLVLVTVIFLLLGSAYFAYGYFMQIGVDQGYMPVQPIHYSHKIHAGYNGIDCKYCHSSARVSKHSGIPSLNVCMNCHKSISEYTGEEDLANGYTREFYTKEIKKLYEAVGWDEETQSYTGETKPVKWVRIHNLPDFAYFNHAQHVTVAGIECQTCHGPVEEMEIMYQHAPLTMGWCINCHRETNIKIEGNEYYEKIHEELSKKYGVEKLTAAQMGGLECGKCHY
ncbi:c-type cytochrome [Ascidiimonas aurantiaca]|uniref:c-type cytochrome n=1 Tax=Ascidiimonas aurantiaca TaxID=1685432 RepID=UPI0030ECED48